jgi:hypothetical protein|tara:strand:- start:1018 stop:1137 length:120 start_codon:yes stop_codon:yes gene_type:complete
MVDAKIYMVNACVTTRRVPIFKVAIHVAAGQLTLLEVAI